ncbi:hypothetical protein JCM18899A_10550 [Nocardioides sp. AN3]
MTQQRPADPPDLSGHNGWLEESGWLPGVQAGFVDEPRQRRSVQSTLQILSAAEAVLAEVGAQGLTMQAVAKRSGVSVGGIYGRFDGKQGLLIAVKDLLLNRMESDLAERLPACTNLYGVVREFVDCLSTHVSQPAVIAVAIVDPEQAPELIERGRLAGERMLKMLTTASEAHRAEIGHEDAAVALRTTRDMALGAIIANAPRPGQPIRSDGRLKIELARACFLYLSSPAGAILS